MTLLIEYLYKREEKCRGIQSVPTYNTVNRAVRAYNVNEMVSRAKWTGNSERKVQYPSSKYFPECMH